MNGGLGKIEEHWQEKRMQEAAAVLGLLVDASLMLTPVDVDALKYIHTTAAVMQVRLLVSYSLIRGIVSVLRSAVDAAPLCIQYREFLIYYLVQGKRIWGRVPKTSALFPVVENCKAALMGS